MSLKLYLILFIILVTSTVIYASPIESNSLEYFEAVFANFLNVNFSFYTKKILEAKNFLNAQDVQDAQDSNKASDPLIFNNNSFIVTLKKFNTDFVAVAKFDTSIVSRDVICAFIINAFVAAVGIALIAAVGAAASSLTIGPFIISGAVLVFVVELCKQQAFAVADFLIRTICEDGDF
ncbi:hypothetical protein C2G38_2143614 [Gigaspora rosea]|uniref:Uncharacterized protein n=1 Tax=Gigaspora rosea TaxID=44941 RepID=A0A397V2Y5_9GLOM|nr:hypothetical protein C2G38_2143614 [Gigaspora rosea]